MATTIVTNQEILTVLQAAGATVTAGCQSLVSLYHPLVEGRVKEYLGWSVQFDTYTEYYPQHGVNRFWDGDPLNGGYDMIGGSVVFRQRGNITRQILPLREIPVRSIVSVYENPAAYATAGGTWPATSLLPANAYFIDSHDGDYSWTGHLYRFQGLWSSMNRTIKVTYTAGLTSAELLAKRPAVKFAILKAVADAVFGQMVKSRAFSMGGLPGSHSIKDFSMSFDYTTLLKMIGQPGTFDLPQDVKQMLEPYRNFNRLM